MSDRRQTENKAIRLAIFIRIAFSVPANSSKTRAAFHANILRSGIVAVAVEQMLLVSPAPVEQVGKARCPMIRLYLGKSRRSTSRPFTET